MNIPAIIEAKRRGRELAAADIAALIDGFHRGQVEDTQMAAFAMAVLWQKMTADETAALTVAMLHSGRIMSWSPGRPVVDKHSTGGVGDKISLPLAPILAELGLRVPMVSGRCLGKTGGTIDKLESIPGYRTDLSFSEFQSLTEQVGCVISAATAEIAPVDKRLYGIRDVTATVPSPALITASILSKKLAEGLDCLLLDVKWGTGAFMETRAEADELARLLVATASRLGVSATAILTDMNRPLGRWIGNAAEVTESIAILEGLGPEDTALLARTFAVELALMAGVVRDRSEAGEQVARIIRDGSGLKRFHAMVAAQGGDLAQLAPLHLRQHEWRADADGHFAVRRCDELGTVLNLMRGGRFRREDRIDHSAAIEVLVQPGDEVRRGQPLLRLWYGGELDEAICKALGAAVTVQAEPPESHPLIASTIGPESVQKHV